MNYKKDSAGAILSEDDAVIRAEGLKKSYVLPGKKGPLSAGRAHPEREALKGVTFSAAKGEFVGVIGRNGSGKSTLLKCLAGVTAPTGGNCYTRGRTASLLELGAGFQMEYTGLQNIEFSLMLAGCPKNERPALLRRVVAFAELGEYIRQPVRTYSTGMFVRLAFGTALCMEPEVLLIDEALSVGDIFFQQKCYRRIRELEKTAAILLVSHDLNAVTRFCSRTLLLHRGVLMFDGPTEEALTAYYRLAQGTPGMNGEEWPESPEPGLRPGPERCAAAGGDILAERAEPRLQSGQGRRAAAGGDLLPERAEAGLQSGPESCAAADGDILPKSMEPVILPGPESCASPGGGLKREAPLRRLPADMKKPDPASLSGKQDIRITGFWYAVEGRSFAKLCRAGQRFEVLLLAESDIDTEELIAGFQVLDRYGTEVFGETSLTTPGLQASSSLRRGRCLLSYRFRWPEVREGDYLITLGIGTGPEVLHQTEQCWVNHAVHIVNVVEKKVIYGLFNLPMEDFGIHQLQEEF